MKTIILCLILSISLIGNINAQDSTKVELTKETIYNDVKSALSQLGDALKVGAEHVYIILVNQQVVYSIINIIIYLTCFIVVIVGYKVTKNTYNSHIHIYQMERGHNGQPNLNVFPDLDDTTKGAVCVIEGIITGLVCVIGLIYFMCTISETITGFVNPEYGAIKEIMNMIK